MKHTRNRKHEWLRIGAVSTLVLAALPVLAVILFFARFVVLGAAIAALATGLVLCLCSARFRDWVLNLDAKQVCYKGLRLATDVAVAPVHSWVRGERDAVVVGSDDIAPTVLGPVSTVELPELGRWVRRGEPMVHLRRGARSVALRAPVSGVVVSRNEALHWRPELVNDEPYTDGWLVRLRSDRARDEQSWLRDRGKARGWFRAEVDRLVGVLAAPSGLAHAVADGGQLVGQLHNQIDDETWRKLSGVFFDGRSDDRDPEAG